jgi:predicted AAA+ superfamily ATPase
LLDEAARMTASADQFDRIVAALERLAPAATPRTGDWLGHPAYLWTGHGARAIERIDAPRPELLRGVDRQKQAVNENVARLAAGHAAHDMLLWGARGMGKSALVRSAVATAQASDPARIALVQTGTDALDTLSALFAELGAARRNYLVFIDDLGFAEGDSHGPRHLRSWLDGGVEARPANVRLAVTSNRRAIVSRHASEQDDPLNPRDAVDDQLALADRFGLSLGFHACSQDEYLEIVRGYAEEYALALTEAEALEWARRRGGRSGRIAWHFITELAGRAGKTLAR